MSNSTNLFQIYTKYKNGNTDALNEHISYIPQFTKTGKYQGTHIQTDCSDIEGIVKKTYHDFSRRYPHYGFCYNSPPRMEFRCELNDIYAEFFHAFLQVVQSENKITSQNQLCSMIKKVMTEQIRSKYLYSDFTLYGSYIVDTDEDGVEINPCDRVAYNQWFKDLYSQEKGSFRPEIKELQHILSSIPSIQNIFSSDAITQKKLVDLLTKSEAFTFKNNRLCLKKLSDISDLMNVSGGNVSEERVTQSLNQIYNTLIKCAIGYVPCKRKEYIKENRNTHRTHKMLSDQTEQTIYRYCKDNSNADKKYIKSLYLLLLQINAVIDNLKHQGFSPDIERIIDICLYDYEPDYWHFTESKNKKFRIYHFGKKDVPYTYILKRSSTIELDSLPECYIIGNCVIYADKSENELYYLQKENRIFSITKRENNYIGYKINYDII